MAPRQNVHMIQIPLNHSPPFSEECRLTMEDRVGAQRALGRRGPCLDGWCRREREGPGLMERLR